MDKAQNKMSNCPYGSPGCAIGYVSLALIKLLLCHSSLNLSSFLFWISASLIGTGPTLGFTHIYSWMLYMVFQNRCKSSSNSPTDSRQLRLDFPVNENMYHIELGCIYRSVSKYIMNRWKNRRKFHIVFQRIGADRLQLTLHQLWNLLDFPLDLREYHGKFGDANTHRNWMLNEQTDRRTFFFTYIDRWNTSTIADVRSDGLH